MRLVPGEYRVLMEDGQLLTVYGIDNGGPLRGEIVRRCGKDSKIAGVACVKSPSWIPRWSDSDGDG